MVTGKMVNDPFHSPVADIMGGGETSDGHSRSRSKFFHFHAVSDDNFAK